MVNIASFSGNIFLDTAPLIYYIEGHSSYQPILESIFEANENGNFKFITSAITLLEVLVKPLKMQELRLAETYKYILTTAKAIEIIDVNSSIAVQAAELRAKYNLHTPDAIQIATAIGHSVGYFITNDFKLKSVTELNIVTLAELN